MKSLLISVIVLFATSCVEHVDNPFLDKIDSDVLSAHISAQKNKCYTEFDNVKTDKCVNCDVDLICHDLVETVKEYAHYNHLCYIIDTEYKDMYHMDCETNTVVKPFYEEAISTKFQYKKIIK